MDVWVIKRFQRLLHNLRLFLDRIRTPKRVQYFRFCNYYNLFNTTVSFKKNESQAEDHILKAQPNACLKKCILSLRLKVFRSSHVRMSRGRLFQIAGAADENLRPASAVFVRGVYIKRLFSDRSDLLGQSRELRDIPVASIVWLWRRWWPVWNRCAWSIGSQWRSFRTGVMWSSGGSRGGHRGPCPPPPKRWTKIFFHT